MTVTHLDGIVFARSMFRHSIHYRSAMIYGSARAITGTDEKLAALRVVAESMAPGQWAVARHPDDEELRATGIFALPLDEASVKVGQGPPKDAEQDLTRDMWAGVLPIQQIFGAPITATPGQPVPAHVSSRKPPG